MPNPISPRKSPKFDKHPLLKGKQSRLPDELQGKIIGSKLRKTAEYGIPVMYEEHTPEERRAIRKARDSAQRRMSKRMNVSPVKDAIGRGVLGAVIGSTKVKRLGLKGGKRGALIGAGALAGLGEIERRVRNKIYKLDGSEKVGSFTKLAGNLEGRMAKRQLTEISEMAQELLMSMGDEEDLHEWVQNKIATIHDRMNSVHSYTMYEKRNPPMMSPEILGTGV